MVGEHGIHRDLSGVLAAARHWETLLLGTAEIAKKQTLSHHQKYFAKFDGKPVARLAIYNSC